MRAIRGTGVRRGLESSGEQGEQGMKGNRRTRETGKQGKKGNRGNRWNRGAGVTRGGRGKREMRGTTGNRGEGGSHYLAKSEPCNRNSGKMFPIILKTFPIFLVMLGHCCLKLPKMLFVS